jgi:uncharacterized protein
MSTMSRRRFLQGSAGAAAGVALAGPFGGLVAHADGGRPRLDVPIGPVADLRDGVVRLWLPQGFSYRSFHDNTAGATLSDGTVMPGRHDGMAAFASDAPGAVVLIRNHEVAGAGSAFAAAAPTYDPATRGGTTNTTVDLEGNVVSSVASLVGTQSNCAGGAMPWGSWITCEETVNGPDVFDDFTRGTLPPTTYVTNVRLTKPHGYIFEVGVTDVSTAEPIRAAGRFAHEAVVYDDHEGVLYLTEDNFGFPSGLYKYVPPVHPCVAGRIEDGGQLFMLAVVDAPNVDLSARQGAGARFRTCWVPIDDPDPTFGRDPSGLPTTTNDQALVAVAAQGWAQGAAYFSRLEGITIDRGRIYFTSTQGGGDPESPDISTTRPNGYGLGRGQVWSLKPGSGRLELVYESPGPDVLDLPDNITVSKRGTLVVCEDGTNFNFIRGVTRRGELFTFAQNQIAGRTGDEFAGATFDPTFSTLYVNIQATNGMTFAIWGPWRSVGF